MKFLVDAQLPLRLARWLRAAGHDVIHTRDLSGGNCTGDAAINEVSLREQRVVLTKDADFVDMFLLRHVPYKLLLVSTGNIGNGALERLFHDNIEEMVKAFETCDFVEIDRAALICHR